MIHLLDNPVWNALNSGNKDLAEGNERAKYFPKDIAPFVGLKDTSQGDFDVLHDHSPAGTVAAVVTPEDIAIPEPWSLILETKLLQMVCDNPAKPAARNPAFPAGNPASPLKLAPSTAFAYNLVPLETHHIPAMIALTKLTNPGPFYTRTIEFGNYTGIFNADQLIAMAGYRLQPTPFIEISAVCTHPDHLGKGFAAALILHLAGLIRANGGIPFLHSRTDNERAIKLYERLGFVNRRQMTINIIKSIPSPMS
jgi:GNAT superfamily N-acetyltransferase